MRIARKQLTGRLVALAVIALLALSGCSEDDSNPVITGNQPGIPDSSLPFPDTADQLMANFRTIYETMDTDEYKLILDPAFVTLLQLETTQEFPLVGSELDETEENRIHDRMFSGEILQGANGQMLPPILTVGFSLFEKIVDWGPSLPTDPIPNTQSALYEVVILADRGQDFSTYEIEGQIRFYVTTAEIMLNGEPETYFRLVGQLDLTDINKAIGPIYWGSLKAMFH